MKENKMKLYHATSKKSWNKIKTEGLKATCSFCGFAGCKFCAAAPDKLKFVYMTDDLKIVKNWGEILLEIDADKLDKKLLNTYRELLCDYLDTTDFYNYAANISPKFIKKLE